DVAEVAESDQLAVGRDVGGAGHADRLLGLGRRGQQEGQRGEGGSERRERHGWLSMKEAAAGGGNAEEKTRDAHAVHTVFSHFSSLSRTRGDVKGEETV